MLQKPINTKHDLITLLQQSAIKKIVCKDIESKDDLKNITKTAESLIQFKSKLTVFLIETQ
jgi:hypothetical protein